LPENTALRCDNVPPGRISVLLLKTPRADITWPTTSGFKGLDNDVVILAALTDIGGRHWVSRGRESHQHDQQQQHRHNRNRCSDSVRAIPARLKALSSLLLLGFPNGFYLHGLDLVVERGKSTETGSTPVTLRGGLLEFERKHAAAVGADR